MTDGRQILSQAFLHPQVGDAAEGIVKPIGEVRHANDQCELDDLAFVVVLAQLLQRALADGRCSAGHPLSIEDCCLVLLVKERAALVEV